MARDVRDGANSDSSVSREEAAAILSRSHLLSKRARMCRHLFQRGLLRCYTSTASFSRAGAYADFFLAHTGQPHFWAPVRE